MRKVVVCTVVATALVLLIISSQSPIPGEDQIPNGISIRRLGLKTPYPTFDPLVAKMERMTEEKTSADKRRRNSRIEEDNRSFYEAGKLNISLRLMVLFPFLDRSPNDGVVDFEELRAWIFQQAIDRLNSRTEMELQERDQDSDTAISFSEYLPKFTPEDIERSDMGHGEAGWWMEQFRNADVDRSGTLNLYEFRDFLHPEDSKNQLIRKWLLKDKIRQLDHDKDQQLSLTEFEDGAYETYKSYFEYETGEGAPSLNSIFSKLDINKNRLLNIEELKPILEYLSPGELAYAKHYARHLINEADDNGDGKLKLNEMMNHPLVFYNTVYVNGGHGEDEDGYHDEL